MAELVLERRTHGGRDSRRGAAGWLALAGWIALSYSAALVGGASSAPGAWYDSLDKAPWNPPSWVFGPAWGVLYLLMGTAAWLVWRERGFAGAKVALGLFVLQLVPNALWSVLFFGMRRPDLAMIDIGVMWISILATMIAFFRVKPLAGWLLVPYLAWVTYAATLNYWIVRMN